MSRLLPVVLSLALLAACGGPGRLVEVPPNQPVVRVTASSFSFDPAQIVARTGETLVLEVHSASGVDHNITVEDPAGAVLRSVALPPGATVTVRVPLASPGVYPFYCAKTMHPTLGMRGRIEAR